MDTYALVFDMIQLNLRKSGMLQWEQYLTRLDEIAFTYKWLINEAGIYDETLVEKLYTFYKENKNSKNKSAKKENLTELTIENVNSLWEICKKHINDTILKEENDGKIEIEKSINQSQDNSIQSYEYKFEKLSNNLQYKKVEKSISVMEAIYVILHHLYKKNGLRRFFLQGTSEITLDGIRRKKFFFWDERKLKVCFLFDEDEEQPQVHSAPKAISKFTNILEQQLLEHEKSIFYRGHEDVTYRLIPSILREKNWIEHEDYMCNQIIMRKTLEFDHCYSNFERLVLMQHYELPTRLLDLTSNPLVALYFACLNTEVDGCVILFAEKEKNIKYGNSDCIRIASALSRLNKKEKDVVFNITKDKDPKFDKLASEISAEKPGFKNAIEVKDVHTCHVVRANYSNNERILRQAGLFITTTDPDQTEKGVDDLRYKQEHKNVVIHIPSSIKKDLLKILDIMDINKASLYMSIKDVSEYIKETTKAM